MRASECFTIETLAVRLSNYFRIAVIDSDRNNGDARFQRHNRYSVQTYNACRLCPEQETAMPVSELSSDGRGLTFLNHPLR